MAATFNGGKYKVILDVDTGVDDALAILYALGSPRLEVLGITTCFGNVDVETATQNTLALVEQAGSDVPVYKGSHAPLLREWSGPVPWIHGDDGMGNVGLKPAQRKAEAEHAVSFIRRMLETYPGEVTLIPVARFTNVARALMGMPDFATLVKQIVFMGGAAFCPGNVTAVAEANVWGDPEAAEIVLQSGANLTMVGLDVTMQAWLTDTQLAGLDASLPYAKALSDAVSFYMNAYGEIGKAKGSHGCALHDPLAVALVEDPSLCDVKAYPVHVETQGHHTDGMTVVDARVIADAPANVKVCVALDEPRFLKVFMERLGMTAVRS
jgi:inosine-uridine nucleoside N-ribohydrolase